MLPGFFTVHLITPSFSAYFNKFSMGVKDLWQVLAPVCERKTLWELQDKTIAVDLSCWVCDSQNVSEYSSQPNMYLRNLFFRTCSLLLLGAVPVFVLEGTAPKMKASVMEQRNAARGFTQIQKDNGNVKRNHLKSIQKKCCELLRCLGVKFLESAGEAEALCALLNKYGLVSGCISQDSDCFLYGAQTVYRNFTITTGNSSTGGPGFSIDSYTMSSVETCLGLTRNKLIALSLLCGCDYLQQGVVGVGKESALKFISTVDDNAILDRLRQWRGDNYYEQLELERNVGGCEQCGHLGKKKAHLKEGCEDCHLDKGCIPSYNPQSLCQMESDQKKTVITELTIRKKALLDPDFPSEQIIEEFLRPNIAVPSKLDTKWDKPDILAFLRFAARFLNWDEVYSFNKFLPILTRWVLLEKGSTVKEKQDSCPVYPAEIKKARVLRGIPSYEIRWADTTGLFDSMVKTAQDSQSDTANMFFTIEPKSLVEKAYPDLVFNYTTQIQEAKKDRRKGKSKSKKISDKPSDTVNKKRCETCGGCGGCLCRFIPLEPKTNLRSEIDVESKKSNTRLKDVSDKIQTRLSPFIEKRQKEKPTLDEMFDTSLILNDDQDYGEADLSGVVMGIVGKEAYFQDLSVKSPEPAELPPNPSHPKPQDSASSDQEFQTHIPLMERIKKKKKKSSTTHDVSSSPMCKKSRKRSDSVSHTYSPLAENVSSEAPPPNARQSILKSEAAKRFSASFHALSRKDLSQSSPLKTSPESSFSLDSGDKFDLGVTRFLYCHDE